MSALTRVVEQIPKRHLHLAIARYSSKAETTDDTEEFRALKLKDVRTSFGGRTRYKRPEVQPPRTNQMKVDQDWGSVWPGPRSFHPATVPIPVRQGYVEKNQPSPGKFGNAELMKIPNFLHLTPPVIKRQCEALKKFCTPWPKALNTDEKCEKYFPLSATSSTYCHSSPTIRDPLSRIVTIKIKLSSLDLDEHAKDKLLRLLGDRYNEETDTISIVTDRCPTSKQNYDYGMYLLTALYHESWTVEPWEKLKSEADMEYYDWEKSRSKQSLESMFNKKTDQIAHGGEYRKCVDALMNEGESEYTITNYGNSVRQLLELPPLGK